MDPASEPGGAVDLEALVVECLELLERVGPAALEELCAAHPALAPQLRRRMGHLQALGLLGQGASESADAAPTRFGDFDLMQPLGGGGMGVVYLARQRDLDRLVALKMIRPELLFFPGTRERFRREVETIARLDHPGVVPVHAVGEHNGVPFFAMPWVKGSSLVQVLRALPDRAAAELSGSDFARAVAQCAGEPATAGEAGRGGQMFAGSHAEVCLRIVRQVADALDHAHRSGVIHRDIKPSNIMVTPDGRAMLLDFGLCHTEGTDRLTRTGSRMGSLHYMAPEQVEGDAGAIGQRTDVYGLGVTLYELLTLSPAFAAPSESEVRARILAGRFAPPARINRALSREVQAICLTAMAADPARRYASAAELARDIDHALAGRPVAARPAGVGYRVYKWVARHPAAALALALFLILLGGVPTLYAVQNRLALQRLQAKQARVDLWFDGATRAVDTMLTRVGDEALRHVPQVEPVRRRLLEDALAFYRAFLATEEGADAALRLEAVRVRIRAAHLCANLGDLRAAEDYAREAIAGLRLLQGDTASSREEAEVHAACELADILRRQGRAAESAAALREAIDRGSQQAPSIERSARLSMLWQQLGLASEGQPEVAAAHFAEALRLADAVVEARPADPHALGCAAVSAAAYGGILGASGQLDAAEGPLRRAVAGFAALVDLEPAEREHQRALARARYTLSSLLATNRADEAALLLDEVIRFWDGEVADFPASPYFRRDLNSARWQRAGLFAAAGDAASAEAWAEASIAELQGVIARFPELEELHCDLAIEATQLCHTWRQAGRLAEARAMGELSVASQEHVLRARPLDVLPRHELGRALHGLARVVVEQGDLAGAADLFQRAADEQAAVLSADPDHAAARMQRRGHLGQLILTCLQLGDHRRAAAVIVEFAEATQDNVEDTHAAIGYLAECAVLAAGDPLLDADERLACIARHDAQALRLARDAAARGTLDLAVSRDAPALRRLRELPEFQSLLPQR